MHGRNVKAHRLPELPDIRVNDFCKEKCKVYAFNGYYWHRHTCMPFLDLAIACGGGILSKS
jgi:G:T-mismatch repair DNA endonuclease (very short patch repair protein)